MPRKTQTVALIPARLQSARLPRKALVVILGLPMIVHVFKRCLLAKTLGAVYVATDSREIADVVERHGGRVVMTASTHETGTDRIAEVATGLDAEVFVNVQGDEALVEPEYIDKVVSAVIEDSSIDVAMLVTPFTKRDSPSDIKTVVNSEGNVMYFSRSDIPSNARTPNAPMLKAYHVVPFRRRMLLEYTSWEKGVLERIEYVEYLRLLERGHKIRAVLVESDAISVDTEEDLDVVRRRMQDDRYFAQYAAG